MLVVRYGIGYFALGDLSPADVGDACLLIAIGRSGHRSPRIGPADRVDNKSRVCRAIPPGVLAFADEVIE